MHAKITWFTVFHTKHMQMPSDVSGEQLVKQRWRCLMMTCT